MVMQVKLPLATVAPLPQVHNLVYAMSLYM